MYAIRSYYVTYEKATYADVPSRFEAGTPAFIQAVGLGEALEYMMNIGMGEISKHELELVDVITSYSIHYTKLYEIRVNKLTDYAIAVASKLSVNEAEVRS